MSTIDSARPSWRDVVEVLAPDVELESGDRVLVHALDQDNRPRPAELSTPLDRPASVDPIVRAEVDGDGALLVVRRGRATVLRSPVDSAWYYRVIGAPAEPSPDAERQWLASIDGMGATPDPSPGAGDRGAVAAMERIAIAALSRPQPQSPGGRPEQLSEIHQQVVDLAGAFAALSGRVDGVVDGLEQVYQVAGQAGADTAAIRATLDMMIRQLSGGGGGGDGGAKPKPNAVPGFASALGGGDD